MSSFSRTSSQHIRFRSAATTDITSKYEYILSSARVLYHIKRHGGEPNWKLQVIVLKNRGI